MMDNNEIIVIEEVMETTSEIATSEAGKGFKIAAGFGLAALGSVIAYKAVKSIVAKIKAKKAQQEIDIDGETIDCEDYEFKEIDEKQHRK